MSEKPLKLPGWQVVYLMKHLGLDNPEEAIDVFIELLILEGIDPMDAGLYIDMLIEKGREQK